MSGNEFEMGAVCLENPDLVATWWRAPADRYHRWQPRVTIFEAAASDEHVYVPSASITVSGKNKLLALRDAIDAALANEPKEVASGMCDVRLAPEVETVADAIEWVKAHSNNCNGD